MMLHSSFMSFCKGVPERTRRLATLSRSPKRKERSASFSFPFVFFSLCPSSTMTRPHLIALRSSRSAMRISKLVMRTSNL